MSNVAGGSKGRIVLRSVLLVYLDDLRGPTVACQQPEPFVSQATFSKYHSMLIPKSEMTQRVCWLFPSGGEVLLLFYPEELKAEHYDRYSLRYTLVLAFETMERYAYIRPDLVEEELSPFAVALGNLAAELRGVEQRQGYLQNAISQWRSARSGPAGEETAANAAAKSVMMIGSKLWVGLDAAFNMVHDCMVGRSKLVHLGPHYQFHLEPVPLVIRVPAVDPHWFPHRVGLLTASSAKSGDILVLDVFGAIDGTRSVMDVAHSLSAEIVSVQEAVEHLVSLGYARLIPPFTMKTCFTTTKVFAADMSEQGRRGGQWLEGRGDQPPVAGTSALLQLLADDEAAWDSNPHTAPLTFTRRDFVQYMEWREKYQGYSFGSVRLSFSLNGAPVASRIPRADLPSNVDMTSVKVSALVRFVATFTYTPVAKVQEVMRAGPFGTLFGSWCDEAVRAAVDFAVLADWLAKVGDVPIEVDKSTSRNESLISRTPPPFKSESSSRSPISLET